MKHLFLKPVISLAGFPPVKNLLKRIAKNQCTIFMLHRFDLSCYGVHGIEGHDPLFLEKCLTELLENGYNIVSIDEVFMAAKEGRTIENAVVFTIDDGYFDHAVVAEKVFAKHHCPITIYLISDFVDGTYWPTEARIEFIVEKTHLSDYQTDIFDHCISGKSKDDFTAQLIWHCKNLTLEQAEHVICTLSTNFSVELPVQTPEKYRALSWDDARRLEKLGISFGAHTSQHPVLSRESDAIAKIQVETSIEKLKQELESPSKVFAYPTGRHSDFGEREIKLTQAGGCIGAVTSEPNYFDLSNLNGQNTFSIARFGFPEDSLNFKQYIFYIEHLKNIARRLT